MLRRVTNFRGLSAFPAISRDGNLLAFAGDQSEAGNLDIWIQQIGGADPVRLTTDEADDTDPTISPDGARIAFRSERKGGGIYVVPTMGGEQTLLVPGGREPVSLPTALDRVLGRTRAGPLPAPLAFVIESGGGQPRQLGTDLAAALYPVWSPQGDAVLALGRRDAADPGADWWTLPLEPGPSQKTDALPALAGQRLAYTAWNTEILPIEWRAGGRVLFASGPGDGGNFGRLRLPAARSRVATRVTKGPAGSFSIHRGCSDRQAWHFPA